MLSDTLQVVTQVAMLVFVVGSMAAMGLGLIVLAGQVGKRAAAVTPAATAALGQQGG